MINLEKNSPILKYEKFKLTNGLTVILHPDNLSPIVTINLLYMVGAKDEVRGITGFSHLFEHLMFEGSKNIPKGMYDYYCTEVGGENNAYTTNDYTDYYISLPSNFIELGLWMESDRMAGFLINQESLYTQIDVVLEEKQTCDDTPYGNSTTQLRNISFDKNHPYSWDTIGTEEDIKDATLEKVEMFYNQYYTPNNSTLVITGDFEIAETKLLVNKYFQDINPSLEVVNRFKQDKSLLEFGNSLVVNDPIAPLNAVFMLFHLPEQNSPDYRALELLSTILGDGESSRLYKTLEYQLEIASDTESYIFEGSLCSMLFIYSIADNNKISASKLEKEIINCIQIIGSEGITVEELEKAKNKNESRINYYIQSLMNRAERLAYFSSFYDNPNMAFNESKLFSNITIEDIKRVCNKYLVDQKHNSVSYFVNK